MGGLTDIHDSDRPASLGPETNGAGSPQPGQKEHREFTRVAIGKRVELRTEEKLIPQATIVSLSLGGLLVRAEEQLPVTTRCEVTIHLAEGDANLQIHARASVVRADRWGMALKFSKVLGLDSLEGLHSLLLDNAAEPTRIEREFLSHQRPRHMTAPSPTPARWRSGEEAPLWLRHNRRPLYSSWRTASARQGERTDVWLSPAHRQILARIEALPEELRALKGLCRKYLQYCSTLNVSVCLIGHRNWDAPLDYLIELYPPARKGWFQTYRKLHGIMLPRRLQTLLLACNGFSFGDFVCFGIPPSMLCTPPTLDENTWQPLDIGTATTEWIQEFPRAQGLTYFAGGPFEQADNVGYFMDDQQIVAMRQDGAIMAQWSQLERFLDEVLLQTETRVQESVPEGWWR